jgi:hypothetical protein
MQQLRNAAIARNREQRTGLVRMGSGLSNASTVSLRERSCASVRSWLVNHDLSAFAEEAFARGLNGAMIVQITDADLREEFPMVSFSDRKRILALIEEDRRALIDTAQVTPQMPIIRDGEVEEEVLQRAYLRGAHEETAAELGRLAARGYISALYGTEN